MLPTLSTLIARISLDCPTGFVTEHATRTAPRYAAPGKWGTESRHAVYAAQEANAAQRAAQGLSAGDSL